MQTKKMVTGGLLIALNIILPYAIHFFPGAGKLLLPMHIGVLLAGLLLGPVYGAVIGAVAPVLSMLISGMPAMPMTIFMTFELAVYGACSGLLMLFFRRFHLHAIVSIYLSLILAMAVGRLIYAGILMLFGFVSMDGVPAVITVVTSFLSGLPGIVIQLVFIPPIVLAVEKTLALQKRA